jgi:hypothetical protein
LRPALDAVRIVSVPDVSCGYDLYRSPCLEAVRARMSRHRNSKLPGRGPVMRRCVAQRQLKLPNMHQFSAARQIRFYLAIYSVEI